MSNLFKQYYFPRVEKSTRVINSDDRFTGFQIPEPEVNENKGFMEGLDVEHLVVEPQPTPDEILEEARQQADYIIAQAQADALQIAREAEKQKEMLFEKMKLEGYKEGASKLQDELIARTEELNAKYQEKEAALAAEYETKLDALETDLVDIMIHVFQKVFNVQFDNKKQILLHLIKDTLLGIDAGKNFVIRVSDANYKYIESHVADIKEKIGNDVTIDVVNDMSMNEQDCMIETATGLYDCGIDMVMTNLEKDIRSLCR